MKRQLRQIYDDLSNGRLSQKEALDKIKALKQQEAGTGVLLAAPVWETRNSVAPAAEPAERHVIEVMGADYSEAAVAVFQKIQTILRGRPQGRVLLQVIINNDVMAGLSGLLKTATLENPNFTGQLILGSKELERRWQEVPADDAPPPAFRDDGVYLITGGLGGVGLLFAREILTQANNARVILTGRAPWSPEKRTIIEGLPGEPGAVRYRQLDLTDLPQVERLVVAIRDEYGQLDGILHCAGMIADDFIVKKDAAQFREVLAPKVTGTLHLDQATRDVPLDFFVLFSSIAGALGNVGQADYAAANGFLDQFAAERNRQVAAGRRHGRTRSVNWPWWEAGGMVLDEASRERFLQTTGIRPMQTATGMDAFRRALAGPHDQLLVVEGDLEKMRLALFSGRPIEPETAVAPAPAAAVEIDRGSLLQKTEDFLRRELSGVLKLPAERIDPQAPLEKYGIDSLLAMRLTGQLEKTFGTLSKTLFFEYQTIRELTRYFVESHGAKLAAIFQPEAAPKKGGLENRPYVPPPTKRRADSPVRPQDAIAIIGISGRYPEAVDLEAYWKNLAEGRDCIAEVPKDRWDWREHFSADRTKSGRHFSKWGGFISGVDEFDPLFFNISPKEAKLIDPQERLFLQHAWMAVEDAGYTRGSLQAVDAGQVGVYAGVMYNEYQLVGAGVAASVASIANRVSYVLNLHGPSMTLDTMCSSSLTAIHLACQDLKLGRTSLAIAGGVNVTIHPNKYLALSAGQFISSDGHCQSFGEGGDGYIPGEGVGVVILKRLSEAERDGDHIYGVIRGSALNHGGKTNGYTVPNPQAQAAAIGQALADARIDARHVSYIEAHGTGTKLGDPIEIAALSKAFRHDTQDAGFCLIGSAKSNIGHCESAAGIAGLTKVLLQMQHRQIVPSLHSARLNPHIDFDATPFVVNQTLREWEQPVVDGRKLPRIAGISSFGAGGSNAHLLIEEYAAPAVQPSTKPVAIVLSARTPEQLKQKAKELLAFVRARRESINLASMAWTLQVGREAMSERLGVIVSSVDELIEKLERDDVGVPEGAELKAWLQGGDVDWRAQYGENPPRRMTLPAYPFARERYWIDVTPRSAEERAKAVVRELREIIGEEGEIHVALLPDGEFEVFGEEEVVDDEPQPVTREIALAPVSKAAADAAALQRKITLAAPSAALAVPATGRRTIRLSNTAPDVSSVRLFDRGDGMFAIEASRNADLRPALERARQEPSLKVLTISGAEHCTGAQEAIASFPYPTIAAIGADFRLGSDAEELARELSTKSQEALRLLKQHLARKTPAGRVDELAELAAAAKATGRLTGGRQVNLQSRVVSATAYDGGIVVVKLEDREAKNMFSPAFIAGVEEVFAHIERTPEYKVVVLTGYDHYFASGGTKESLLAIQAGKVKFTDAKIFQLPLECSVPVVAAMQGHGIGAGWCLGMFADFVLLAEESRYVSPYMNYGFTPGAGATFILPEKLGQDLARESLLTGRTYTGRELKEKGLRLPVLPRENVLPAAMELAERIAQQPRQRLVEAKQRRKADSLPELEETLRLELAMHEKTFVGQSATLARIEDNFHQEVQARPAAVVAQGDAGVMATLRILLAAELQMRESDVADDMQFVDMGLDSISGVSWIRKINEKYRTSIEATKVYSYPTLTQLSAHVKEEAEKAGTVVALECGGEAAALKAVADAPALQRKRRRKAVPAVPSRTHQPIAVIGMAGQFPQAKDLDQYWRNIAEGRNCISRVDRWDLDAFYEPGEAKPGKTNSQWLGALEEYDRFDPRFFNISPTEALSMDPQQRLFLQACWHSIENAGYDARTLSGSKCGVFVGCATGDYHQLSRQHQLTAHGFTGMASSILASRISYHLNLQGPCVAVDTACSSSLVAIAQACDSLTSGDSDLAMAGGVYVMAGPEMHIRTAQAGMLSPEGRCFTFDQRADGFVPGEGVGVVVLKRLADAQRDGDEILGVIEGWGVNQDGKTNGITAPNPESQTRLMRDVYDKYGIDPAGIQLIEAHGTGTKLGDPIEVEGLKAAFRNRTQGRGYCAIGSVKSNIGHTLTAAGIAGVIKLLLALKHRQLPPTIHFERLNEHIDLDGTPFYVNTSLQPWELHGAPTRRAAISSFGFSGTNAHLVISEGAPAPRVRTSVPAAAIPLSARTPEQLRQRAEDLLAFVRDEPSLNLGELAYTLQVGRVAMDERLAFVVSSIAELREKIEAWLRGDAAQDLYQGHAKKNKEALSLFTSDPDLQETIGKWIAKRRLPRLVDLWVKGLELDWNQLHDAKPRRVAAPLYPFAKERYWIEAEAVAAPTAMLAAPVWQTSDAGAEIAYAERHVLSLQPESSYEEQALACFDRVQSILNAKPQGKVLLQVVASSEGLSGLLKTAALENPHFTGQLILGAPTQEELQRENGLDPVVRYERGARQVLRWQEVAVAEKPIAFKEGGVYLITGGTGGLGQLFAREIAARGGRAILTGRRQVDLSNPEDVRRLIAECGPINGILHCAGMTADQLLVKKTAAEFRAVLEPKVTGTRNLDEATKDLDLDFFVLFSSIASALGNAGQADYAAANGFLDQFAAHRNRLVAAGQRRGRTRSIHWPLWQAGGMAIDAATREVLQQTIGVRPMQTATGIDAFYRSLALPHDETLVVDGTREKIVAYLQKARIFEGAAVLAPTTTVTISVGQLEQQIKTILAGVLGLDASTIDLDQPFNELGLDSFLGAELVVAINKQLGTELSHLRLFDYATVRELANYLQPEMKAVAAPARGVAALECGGDAAAFKAVADAPALQKIAIIGMSGRYPQANDLNHYWANLVDGKNAVTEVTRWDVDRYYDADRTAKDKTYSKWLGAVDDFDCFDPLFFRISPQEAEFMDPQHRLFLQESYKAFEDAGYSTATLSNRKCGVYLGISTNEYTSLLARHDILSAPVTSNSYAIAAARIAYYLNLKGPALSVDTACSSSLVAIHLACQAIRNGEIDMALAGGVSLWMTPDSYVAMSKAGMFSPDGQCKTFDDSANGIVNGEGVGAVVLKRLADAQRDGDTIYGVILATGINQDGRTNGITAPSVNSQIELERAVYAKHGIDPESISYIECHGTGTKLGDPIELEALSTVFQERTSKKNFCALGSVKSNIGHTTSAAGVAGLHKVLLSMRHRTLVPTLHVTKENAKFDFQSSPFYISRETKAWEAAPGAPRRAAVSSFGFSGTNAHMVVEEYVSATEQIVPGPCFVPLSARTEEQLRQKAEELLAYLQTAQPLDIAAVAYTLQVGREAFEQRVGFVASSGEELAEKLSAWLNGARAGDDHEWVRGQQFDWNQLYAGVKPRRVSLPTYPFAKERCWFDGTTSVPAQDNEIASEADIRSIEAIIKQIDDDAMETDDAVQALRTLL